MKNSNVILSDAKMLLKYYAVHCKCGHVGLKKYVEIVFAVMATNGKEAARIAREFARVKHHQKYAIIDCYKITREEYERILEANKNDPYLKCKNIQEQRRIDGFESRIIREPECRSFKRNKRERKAFIEYKLKKQREITKAIKDIYFKGDYSYEVAY